MHVMIDNVHYVPWSQVPAQPSLWRLTLGHLDAAKEWPDWFECLQWAVENEATAVEMKAWRRAIHGQDLVEPEPKKKIEPLPVPGKRRALFS